MVLFEAGAISLGDVADELNLRGAGEIKMSNLYSVDSGLSLVPSSGTIKLSDFRGAQKGNSVVKSATWPSIMTTTNSGGVAIVQAGTSPNIEYQLTQNGTNSTSNTIWNRMFLQYATSFTATFEIYTVGAADAMYFFCGATTVPTLEYDSKSSFMVIFDIYASYPGGDNKSGPGVYLANSASAVVKAGNYVPNTAWRAVAITYTRGTINTWKVNVDGQDVLTYSDPNNATWLYNNSSGDHWGIGARCGGGSGGFSVRKLNMSYKGLPLKPPITSGLVGYYNADSSLDNVYWRDLSGSGNHGSWTGTVSKEIGGINGYDYMYGGTSTKVVFPSAILPSTFTLFHLTRYNGANRKRIFTSTVTGYNWLSGHWNGLSGVGYHEGWITDNATTRFDPSEWLLSTDQRFLYRGNMMNFTIVSDAHNINTSSLGINYYGAELSDWACACIIVYNRELTLDEINTVENWIVSIFKTPIVYPVSRLTSNTTTITNRSFGNGVYTASASSTFSGVEDAFSAFDEDASSQWTVSLYTLYSNGNYVGSQSTTVSNVTIGGEWIQLQLPFPIRLRSYIFKTHDVDSYRMPRSWVIAGSTDGTTWTLLDSRSDQTLTVKNFYTSYVSGVSNTYRYFRMIIRNLTNVIGNAWCSINELKFLENFSPLALSPYYYFPFDVNANDVLQGLTPTVTGACTFVHNRINFPGNTVNSNPAQYVTISTATNLLYSPVTISLWFNTFDIPTSTSVILVMFPFKIYVAVNSGATKVLASVLTDAVWNDIYSTSVVTTNKWMHVAVTHENKSVDSTTKLYVNGALEVANNTVGKTTASNTGFYLSYDGLPRAFKGAVNEMAIFNRVLSAQEIFLLRQGTR